MTGLHLPLTFPGPAWSSRAFGAFDTQPNIGIKRTDYRSHQFSDWTGPLYAQSAVVEDVGFGPERKELRERNRVGVGQAVPSAELVVARAGVEGAAVEADAAVEAVASAPRATVATV